MFYFRMLVYDVLYYNNFARQKKLNLHFIFCVYANFWQFFCVFFGIAILTAKFLVVINTCLKINCQLQKNLTKENTR